MGDGNPEFLGDMASWGSLQSRWKRRTSPALTNPTPEGADTAHKPRFALCEEQARVKVCLAGRSRSAARKPQWRSMAHMLAVTWTDWPQTVPAESSLSNWKNRADVCEQLSTVV